MTDPSMDPVEVIARALARNTWDQQIEPEGPSADEFAERYWNLELPYAERVLSDLRAAGYEVVRLGTPEQRRALEQLTAEAQAMGLYDPLPDEQKS